jgi:hypothetical protein
MKRLPAVLAALFISVFGLSAPAQAVAAPTQGARAGSSFDSSSVALVTVRVEGATNTIFEFPVVTYGHDVTTSSGGTHHCDGTNNGTNPTPGPTATGALDNGAHVGGFTWDGTYFPSFDDYLVSRVAGESQTDTQFWGLLLNGQFTLVGGCQQRVQTGDEVLFAFDAFSKSHALKLTGPTIAHVGHPARYHVIDTFTGLPIAGATVGGVSSDADGNATVTFGGAGVSTLKAERADSIRSNRVVTVVLP